MLKPGLRDVPAFDGKTISTNSMGLRGKREFSYTRTGKSPRILILGDSFTFGDEVGDHESFPSMLQARMPQAEVINMGVHGYSHDQMLILLREEGLRYAPDIVILGFIYIDVYRNMLGFRDYAKPRFESGKNGLRLVDTPVPPPDDVLRGNKYRSRLADFARLGWTRTYYSWFVNRQEETDHLARDLLAEIARECRTAGAEPLFAFLPTGRELADNILADTHESRFHSFRDSAQDAEWISMLPLFRQRQEQGVTFKETGHWLPQGHDVVSAGLYDYLSKAGYLASE